MNIKHQFKREEHVYVNDEFSELLKDAVRFFHGTPVLPLPLEKSFCGAGVYAIYCIAKKGIYRPYGERINRLSYDVPIYVGQSMPSGDTFRSMTVDKQMDFWRNCFQTTLHMSSRDFAVRVLSIEDMTFQNQLRGYLVEIYKPIWNRIFQEESSVDDMMQTWRLCHDVRFTRKATSQDALILRENICNYLSVA